VLNSTESDYIYRTAVVINSALKLFEGDQLYLQDWLTRPALALGQKAPTELLTNFVGLRMVETLIWRVEYSVVA
jgi:putative toxin-antitoxin system antitoxin component (TIGR02293 family)